MAAYSEPADYLNSVKIKLWDPQQCFLQCFLTVTPALPEWQSHHWQEMMTLNYFTLHHITTATYLRRLVSMSRDALGETGCCLEQQCVLAHEDEFKVLVVSNSQSPFVHHWSLRHFSVTFKRQQDFILFTYINLTKLAKSFCLYQPKCDGNTLRKNFQISSSNKN